jgi:hypothetical protein
MNRLPADVVLSLAASFLLDAESCRFSQSDRQLQSALRTRYVRKEPIPATRWKEVTSIPSAASPPDATASESSSSSSSSSSTAAAGSAVPLPSRAFGRPRLVAVTTSDDRSLLLRLDEIAPSATDLIVRAMLVEGVRAWRLPRGLKSVTLTTAADIFDSCSCPLTSEIPLPDTLERLDLGGVPGDYVVNEQLHAEGRLSQFPNSLTYLRLPQSGCQLIDGRFFSFPPNLLQLHN